MRYLGLSSKIGGFVALLVCGCGGGLQSERPQVSAVPQVNVGPGDPAHNLLKQSNFDSGSMLPWMTSFTEPITGEGHVKDGALCVNFDQKGKDRWDAQIRHREMLVQKGHSYTVSFKAWASRPTSMTGKVGMSGPPYQDYWTKKIDLTDKPQQFAYRFNMTQADDPTVEFAFHFAGGMFQGTGPLDICFDDIILSDPAYTPPPPAAAVVLPKIRVNQLGYLPKLEKVATLLSDSKQPVEFSLLDAKGQVVNKGQSKVVGLDAASGDTVHVIDFSSYATPGKGFVLQAGDAKSDPFDIDAGIYSKLKYDAFKYFYFNRSGTPIDKAYVPRPDLARPAGHVKDEAGCTPDATGCNYKLDVTGGWYDAGDYGKYIVNGGIAVWTLMNWYERAKHLGGDVAAFGDVKGLIPESQNKVPDILDEARWEIEFFLKMQVPEGKTNAGMVHHKIHDVEWTALGLAPHESTKPRQIHPVSTAATLNFAAAVAQAARIWKDIDPKFSKTCLDAAERAWKAAKQNPKMLASQADHKGGGPYDDSNLADEFYWAAAELYVTTGQEPYADELKKSPLDAEIADGTKDPDSTGTTMTWQRVDSLGKISLAVVPSKLPAAARDKYRKQIEKAAKEFETIAERQGYRVPLEPSKSGKYPWGSNSFVLNNALTMALAYDFTKDPSYLRGVALGMDYVLGRNPMGKSYITGYGARPLEFPHHRFWAFQANAKYPKAPPGVVSGGPNSGLEDPYVKAAGLMGCAPEKCFVDNSDAWSTNEITINWNAPLMWVTAWLDEHSK